jgi:hypothetical protein
VKFSPPAVVTLRDRMDIGTFAPVGWTPPPSPLSHDGWTRTGATILVLERATPWLWGDWWRAREFGRDELPADWNCPDLRTLDNYATVAKTFPIHRRRENLSFSHHQALTNLSVVEQDAMLDWCAAQPRPSLLCVRKSSAGRRSGQPRCGRSFPKGRGR